MTALRKKPALRRIPGREPCYVKKVKAGEYALWKKRGPFLPHLDIELTERCNNDCIHCYINRPGDDPEAMRRELTTAEFKRVLDEAAKLGALSVRFTGGEPLLREDFQELYLHARGLGLKVLIFTNARLVTPELAGLFARVPPLEDIEISVYGMTKKSYEKVTRKTGSFKEHRRGIRLLLERQIPFVVKSAMLPPNRHERKAFESWARRLPAMKNNRMIPTSTVRFDLRGRRDSEAKNASIRRLRPAAQELLKLWHEDRASYVKGMEEFCSRFMGPQGDRLFGCGAGRALSVDAYGFVQPCLLLRHPDLLYDWKSGTLKQALTTFFPRLRPMEATNKDYLSRCSQCFLKGLCDQCPAMSWMEHGKLDTPVEYLCQMAHARARDLGLLTEGEKAWEVIRWRNRLKAWLSKK